MVRCWYVAGGTKVTLGALVFLQFGSVQGWRDRSHAGNLPRSFDGASPSVFNLEVADSRVYLASGFKILGHNESSVVDQVNPLPEELFYHSSQRRPPYVPSQHYGFELVQKNGLLEVLRRTNG